jgi:D-sedoheptulose 7-phosphate isomerase
MAKNILNKLSFSRLTERYPALKEQEGNVLAALDLLIGTLEKSGSLWAFGNGGSSADAEHFCGELTKDFIGKRALSEKETAALDKMNPDLKKYLRGGISAIALSSQHSSLSAFSNDVDYKYAYAQLVWAVGKPGDVAFGISTSGNSANVVHALQAAKAKGLKTIALTGSKNSKCKEIADVTIQAPSEITHEAQEFHLPIYHAMCLELENHFWG